MADIISLDFSFTSKYDLYKIECTYDPRTDTQKMIAAMSVYDDFINEQRALDIQAREMRQKLEDRKHCFEMTILGLKFAEATDNNDLKDLLRKRLHDLQKI